MFALSDYISFTNYYFASILWISLSLILAIAFRQIKVDSDQAQGAKREWENIFDSKQ